MVFALEAVTERVRQGDPMQDDDRRAEAQSGLLDDIRRIVEEEGAPRPTAAFAPASEAGVFALTPDMLRGAAGAPLPRGPLPPAEDEEPPLVLTRRVDQPEQPFGTGSAATPPSSAPADAEPGPSLAQDDAFAVPERSPPEAGPASEPEAQPPSFVQPGRLDAEGAEQLDPEGAAPGPARDDETGKRAFDVDAAPQPAPSREDAVPTDRPRGDPEPAVVEAIPESASRFGATATDAPDPDKPERSEGVDAARIPRFGAPYGHAAAPKHLRRAFASDSAPGPIPASGLPRSRDELLALTRQAIREELAGPLGERISQNIKLLIEREVRRAIADLPRDRPDEGGR